MIPMTPEQHYKRYSTGKAARASLEAYWQELAYFGMPRKAWITRFYNIGDRFPNDLFDNTAINAVEYLAAGIQGYMTNPHMRWFGIRMRNKAIMNAPGVADWCRDSEDQVYDALNGANFYQENNEGYRDLGVLGSHVLYEDEDAEDLVRFTAIPLEKAVWFEDHNRRVRTIYIEFEYTADQAFEKFGNTVDDKIKKCLETKDYMSKFKFIFAVFPREIYDPSKKDKRNMPFAALWIQDKTYGIVKEGGYKEFPFFVPRWARMGGDVHGASPLMNELPNVKTLNAMEETNLMAGEMTAMPPWAIPDEAFIRPFDLSPGGMNIKSAGFPGEKIEQLYQGGNVPFSLQMADARRLRIEKALFNDLFIVLNNQSDMTAEEVRQRVAERMLLLGPAIGQLVSEYCNPIVVRTFNILARAGRIAQPPAGLEGQEFEVIATSPLARAQKMVELQGLNMSMSMISQFAAVDPQVLDKIKFDTAVDFVAEVTNLNPKLIRDDAEVADIRNQRAESQAKAYQMQMIQQGTETLKTATEADKNLEPAAPQGAK